MRMSAHSDEVVEGLHRKFYVDMVKDECLQRGVPLLKLDLSLAKLAAGICETDAEIIAYVKANFMAQITEHLERSPAVEKKPGLAVVTASCHEMIEPHFHLQASGWTNIQGKDKPVQIFRIDYHDPKNGDQCTGISLPVEAP